MISRTYVDDTDLPTKRHILFTLRIDDDEDLTVSSEISAPGTGQSSIMSPGSAKALVFCKTLASECEKAFEEPVFYPVLTREVWWHRKSAASLEGKSAVRSEAEGRDKSDAQRLRDGARWLMAKIENAGAEGKLDLSEDLSIVVPPTARVSAGQITVNLLRDT